jgi:hypothetical protein
MQLVGQDLHFRDQGVSFTYSNQYLGPKVKYLSFSVSSKIGKIEMISIFFSRIIRFRISKISTDLHRSGPKKDGGLVRLMGPTYECMKSCKNVFSRLMEALGCFYFA